MNIQKIDRPRIEAVLFSCIPRRGDRPRVDADTRIEFYERRDEPDVGMYPRGRALGLGITLLGSVLAWWGIVALVMKVVWP